MALLRGARTSGGGVEFIEIRPPKSLRGVNVLAFSVLCMRGPGWGTKSVLLVPAQKA